MIAPTQLRDERQLLLIPNTIVAKLKKQILTQFTGRVAYVPPYAILIAGLLVTGFISTALYKNAQREFLNQQYNEQAVPLSLSLGRSVDRYLETVHQIAALYTASNSVTRTEFGAFVDRSLVRNPGIQALEWIPRVLSADRESFEKAVTWDEVSNFRITERTSAGELIEATERAEHFPVFYIEPREGNEAALGFDLASNPARLEALNRARDTGEAVATQRIRLIQETGDQFGLLVFVPVYNSKAVPVTVAERRQKLTGFALGVFRIGDMLDSAIHEIGDPDFLDIYIFDSSAPPDARFLNYRQAKQADGQTQPRAQEAVLAGEHLPSYLPFAGRDWQLVFVPRYGFEPASGWMLWLVTVSGLIVTALLVLYLRTIRNRSLDIEQVVTERTEQLNVSNQALEEEMAVRQSAEWELQWQNKALQTLQRATAAGITIRSTEESIRSCIDEICAHTGWPVGHAFVLTEGASRKYVSSAIWRLDEPERYGNFVSEIDAIGFGVDEGLIGQIIAGRKSRWVADVTTEPGYLPVPLNSDCPVRGAFFVPILDGRSTISTVLVFYSAVTAQPDPKILDLVNQISTQFGRVAERLRANQQRREREKFLQMVTDNIPVVITYFYADMKVGFINKLGASWFNSAVENLVGRVIYDVIESLDIDEFKDCVRKVLAGEPQSFESEISYPDGITRHVIIDYVPHFDENGSVVGYFGIVQDVSQRKLIERQLSQAQKMEAIGHLTGGIAHDFNNLLMVIGGYTRRAFDAADDPKSVQESLGEAMKGTDRAAQLTKQLLSFSRRQVIEKRVFRVDEAVGELEDMMQRSTGERHAVCVEANSRGACIETDDGEFGQAILNLVINARDAMPGGGSIKVATSIVDLNEDYTLAREELTPGRYVKVSIADEGTGIDAETLEHIFEPFFTTKDQGKGTGLGLAMVYGFVQQSGGAIDVESTVGEGTTFNIYMPVSDRNPEVLIAEVEEDQHGKGETILLVEDDGPVLALVCGMLEALGYNVLTANDGLAALEVDAEHEGDIDLILSDVVMPGLGGFEAASMVRESRADVKLLFMSGYPNRGAAGEEVMPENSQFLQKPVDPSHLARALRKELDSPAQCSQLISMSPNEPELIENAPSQ